MNISNQYVILQPSGSDIFNLFITGNNSYVVYSFGINVDFNYFNTGQSVILKIRNSFKFVNGYFNMYLFLTTTSGLTVVVVFFLLAYLL